MSRSQSEAEGMLTLEVTQTTDIYGDDFEVLEFPHWSSSLTLPRGESSKKTSSSCEGSASIPL